MPILPGIATVGSSVASACSSLVPEKTVFDGAALTGAAFYATRINTARQGFERRLDAIDYKIERQQLHREDIRDLVELTTNRMEIYHLVGTLLLTFCMDWYVEEEHWELPIWFSGLFRISHYAAVGYLVLCVWLSMYASVAARAIGTRLLTSQMRLSLPTKTQLDSIMNLIFFSARNVISRAFARSSASPDLAVPVDKQDSEAECPGEDHNQHFRIFLMEARRWLVYDTWSRVCMSFGMDQMLQALSYFSLGIIWSKTPLGAIVSYLSINCLSTYVLLLDLGALEDADYMAVTLLSFMPPILCCLILVLQSVIWETTNEENDSRYVESVLVALCFFAHGGWLYYLVTLFRTAGDSSGRFKPGAFANVLEWIPQSHHIIRKGEDDAEESLFTRMSSSLSIRNQERSSRGFWRSLFGSSSSKAPEAGDGTSSTKQENVPGVNQGVVDQAPPSTSASASSSQKVNGGRTPGTWMNYTADKPLIEMKELHSPKWLPVKIISQFTYAVIFWWIVAGTIHAFTIAFDKHVEHHKVKDFIGSDDVVPLKSKILEVEVEYPEPASLFRVAGLFCSESQVWVSSGFAMYAMEMGSSAVPHTLSLVQDGEVDALVCGGHGCDALSPPDGKGSWVLRSLEPGHSAAQVPLPRSWRKVTGEWVDCPPATDATCTSAWVAGWDGTKVIVAMLQMHASSSTWFLHTPFEADPTIGLCPDGPLNCKYKGPQQYTDMSSLQISDGGRRLFVLLGSGILDIWDLSNGIVLKRTNVGKGYTSMCRSGGSIFMAREGSTNPVISTLALPASLLELVMLQRSNASAHRRPLQDFHMHHQPNAAHHRSKFSLRRVTSKLDTHTAVKGS